MNKKLFFGLFAATNMLFVTSCSNDELTQVMSGEYADVSISLGVEEVAGSRAISDGTGADELYYAVFNSTGQRITTIAQVHKTGVTFPTTETITLAKGQTYKVAFWAQDDDCTAYTVSDDMNVAVDYTGINNDETRDAFFKTVEFTVNGSTSLDVELKRPFAQINVGVETTDWDAAVASGITIKESNVTIENAATSINLVTGEVDGSVKVDYTTSAIPAEPLKANNSTYNWLSMSYILVNDGSETGDTETTLKSLNYTFTPESGNTITFKEGLNNVPVKRNWRTNILGKILTGDIQFNISIDPIYDGEYTYPDGSLEQQLEFAATFGGEVTLTNNATLTENLVVAKDMKLNLNGFTLTGGKSYSDGMTGTDISALTVDNGANLVVSGEGTIEGKVYGVYVKNGTATIKVGNIKAGTSAVQVYNGTANIEGGNFSTTGTDKRYVINCIDSSWKNGSAKVNITGGTFEEFDPANNAAEGTGTNFCAEGYKSAKVGDNYVVVADDVTVASTLDEVKEGFAKGGKVLLVDNIEFEKITPVEAGKEVYLDLNGKTITVDQNTTSNTLIWVKEGGKLTIDGNGTFDLKGVSTMAIFAPYGELVIENGTFIRDEVTTVTKATTGLFMGCKTTASNVTINGGYFDGGYYDENAADIEDILAGTKEFKETDDDIVKRGNSKDANLVRIAIKDNVSVLLNHSGYGSFKVYGGTFVGANPAWGDEGCMLPTSPNYLRPWSYYQGGLLAGQTFNENELVIPEGYTIDRSVNADNVPVYTVTYNK